MNDEQLESLYAEAFGESHIAALRAVFKAGARSISNPEPTPEVQRAESNRAIAKAKAAVVAAEEAAK